MAPPGASSPPPPAAAPALNASAACRQLRDPHRSQPSLLDGPLGRLLKDDPSPSPLKDGLHRTLTFRQRLAFHLQLHLRILLEHLGVARLSSNRFHGPHSDSYLDSRTKAV